MEKLKLTVHLKKQNGYSGIQTSELQKDDLFSIFYGCKYIQRLTISKGKKYQFKLF